MNGERKKDWIDEHALKEWTTYAFKDPGDLSACLRDFNTELQQRLAAVEAEREANDDEHHNLVADLVTQRDRATLPECINTFLDRRRAKLAAAQARCAELPMNGEQLARRFHLLYESMAPAYGYETRTDTREFDPTSKNGQLMVAVCSVIQGMFDARLAAYEALLREACRGMDLEQWDAWEQRAKEVIGGGDD